MLLSICAGFCTDRYMLAANSHLTECLNLFNLLNDERLSTPDTGAPALLLNRSGKRSLLTYETCQSCETFQQKPTVIQQPLPYNLRSLRKAMSVQKEAGHFLTGFYNLSSLK